MLHSLSKEVATNESQYHTFKAGYGTNEDYCDRFEQALIYKCREYNRCPDNYECKEIPLHIKTLFHFSNCVALMDDKLLPLANAPISDHSTDYHGKKFP